MKTLPNVSICGLLPVPSMSDTQAYRDIDDDLPAPDDANAALLAWYRHVAAERLATNDEIARVLQELKSRAAPWDAK